MFYYLFTLESIMHEFDVDFAFIYVYIFYNPI